MRLTQVPVPGTADTEWVQQTDTLSRVVMLLRRLLGKMVDGWLMSNWAVASIMSHMSKSIVLLMGSCSGDMHDDYSKVCQGSNQVCVERGAIRQRLVASGKA